MPTPQDDPIDLSTSVAGEEDPGAGVEVALERTPAPTGAETVCPRCGGSGQLGATPCAACDGTGKVLQGPSRG
jgi:DnaJ-class molecular chaperone